MVRAGSSSSSSSGGGGGEAGGAGGGGGGGGSSAGGSSSGSGRHGRSRQRSRKSRLSAKCPGGNKMSPSSKKVECFSPMLCHCKVACTNSTISLMFGCKKYRHHDEDSSPQEQSSPQLTEEAGGPELVQVAEKNLSQIENVHGYVTHAHISPMKVASLECIFDGSSSLGHFHSELPSPTPSTLYPHGEDSPLPSCSSNPYPPIQIRTFTRGLHIYSLFPPRLMSNTVFSDVSSGHLQHLCCRIVTQSAERTLCSHPFRFPSLCFALQLHGNAGDECRQRRTPTAEKGRRRSALNLLRDKDRCSEAFSNKPAPPLPPHSLQQEQEEAQRSNTLPPQQQHAELCVVRQEDGPPHHGHPEEDQTASPPSAEPRVPDDTTWTAWEPLVMILLGQNQAAASQKDLRKIFQTRPWLSLDELGNLFDPSRQRIGMIPICVIPVVESECGGSSHRLFMRRAEPPGPPLLLLTCAARRLINWLQTDEREVGSEEEEWFFDSLEVFLWHYRHQTVRSGSEGSNHHLLFNLQSGISSRKMTTHYLRQEFPSKALNSGEKRLLLLDPGLQESIAHLHPLQRQHAIELHRQQLQQQNPVQASLSTFTSCTVPASFRARSRFLNLRDSVKKSPTKSTAKVLSSRKQVPWIPFAFSKVLQLG
ncbi:hypothetical protein CRENBAI_012878 [Crenichthys baileyi]|uniref:Disks large homologue 1 N-terminal PEST domain-containing protein n=1 Tax=Crenichthys baileyi TaxID=28760 RepID=A0AAV9RFP5_9TELE